MALRGIEPSTIIFTVMLTMFALIIIISILPPKIAPRIDLSSKTTPSFIKGEFIISMSLYGADKRYTVGALHNAKFAKLNFPQWTLRIYVEEPSAQPRFALVPADIIRELRELDVDIQYIDTNKSKVPPMMWRFLVGDDETVDRFIVRDADSRLTPRDAAAVHEWIKSEQPFHCIRDHPSHAMYAVSGGLWGGRRKEVRKLLPHSWSELMKGKGNRYIVDMEFLNNLIWPLVKGVAYCSDSVSCRKYPNAFPFPVSRNGYEHVGQVYNDQDVGRQNDMDILRRAGENQQCVPKSSNTASQTS